MSVLGYLAVTTAQITGYIIHTLVHPMPTASLLLPPGLSSLNNAHDSSTVEWPCLSRHAARDTSQRRAFGQESRLSLQLQTSTDGLIWRNATETLVLAQIMLLVIMIC